MTDATATATAKRTGGLLSGRLSRILLAGLGGFVALATVGALDTHTHLPWVIASFGASCVLLFGFPDAPFSRVRNAIGGHLLSTLVGLAFLHAFGPGWLPMAAAGACAIMLMIATDTTHPPAGSNPLIVFLAQEPLPWSFVLTPVLAGIVVIVVLAKSYQWLQVKLRD